MITLPGTLFIQSLKREDKTERLIWLDTSIGQFNVKHDQLTSLKEGWYEGFFEIKKISQGYYKTINGFNFEPEAILNKIAFHFTVGKCA